MNKKPLFLGLVFLLTLLTVNSALGVVDLTSMNSNSELYYSFDNSDLSGSNPLDLTPNFFQGKSFHIA